MFLGVVPGHIITKEAPAVMPERGEEGSWGGSTARLN